MDEVNRLSNLLNSITTIETDSVNAARELLLLMTEIETDSVNAACELLLCTKTIYSDHKDDVIKQYDLTGEAKFNIFETISDLYTREKFHSDILFTILDSNTPEIGTIYNKEILEEFVKMVDDSFKFIVDDNVQVFKEKSNVVWDGKYNKPGYIDLLITNANNQAIIVENKIKDAPDMGNQLVRYMKYVKEQEFGKNMTLEDFNKNVRVVYLTLIPGKIPNIDKYDDSFAEYKQMLSDAKSGKDGKILKYRSAVDSCKDKPDLVTFLNNCIKLFGTRTDDKALLKKIYLEQYKTLLGHLGGNAAMLEYQKDLLKEIYSSPEKLKAAKDLVKIKLTDKKILEYQKDVLEKINSSPKAANDLVEVFNDENIEKQYINDLLRPILENKEMGFAFDNWGYRLWNKEHSVNFYISGQYGFQIGFNTQGCFTEEEQLKYEKILADVVYQIKQQTNEVENVQRNGTWVWFVVKPLAGKNNMKEFLEYCTSFIPQIKKEFQKTQV